MALLAARMTGRSRDKREAAAGEDEWRRFERDNLIRFQGTAQRAMSATVKRELSMLKLVGLVSSKGSGRSIPQIRSFSVSS